MDSRHLLPIAIIFATLVGAWMFRYQPILNERFTSSDLLEQLALIRKNVGLAVFTEAWLGAKHDHPRRAQGNLRLLCA